MEISASSSIRKQFSRSWMAAASNVTCYNVTSVMSHSRIERRLAFVVTPLLLFCINSCALPTNDRTRENEEEIAEIECLHPANTRAIKVVLEQPRIKSWQRGQGIANLFPYRDDHLGTVLRDNFWTMSTPAGDGVIVVQYKDRLNEDHWQRRRQVWVVLPDDTIPYPVAIRGNRNLYLRLDPVSVAELTGLADLNIDHGLKYLGIDWVSNSINAFGRECSRP